MYVSSLVYNLCAGLLVRVSVNPYGLIRWEIRDHRAPDPSRIAPLLHGHHIDRTTIVCCCRQALHLVSEPFCKSREQGVTARDDYVLPHERLTIRIQLGNTLRSDVLNSWIWEWLITNAHSFLFARALSLSLSHTHTQHCTLYAERFQTELANNKLLESTLKAPRAHDHYAKANG